MGGITSSSEMPPQRLPPLIPLFHLRASWPNLAGLHANAANLPDPNTSPDASGYNLITGGIVASCGEYAMATIHVRNNI